VKEAEMHAKTYPGIGRIVSDLREFSLPRELRSLYNLFQKAQRDRWMWEDEYFRRGRAEGAAHEREKWEAVRSENEEVRSKNEAVMSENEALRRELERVRREQDLKH
jgi:hypothetical protein